MEFCHTFTHARKRGSEEYRMLFGLAQSLRSLKSPMASLVQEAHRMARRRLEVGGGVGMGCGGVDARVDPNEFILPADVDADEVVKAVEAELRRRGDHRTDAPPVLKRRRG